GSPQADDRQGDGYLCARHQVGKHQTGIAGSFYAASVTITLPSGSVRPMNPGSITVVASGCSRIAGPAIMPPTGRSRRAQMLVSRHPPSNQTGRDPSLALASDAVRSGANTAA